MLDRGSASGWLVPTHPFTLQGGEPAGFCCRYAQGAAAAAAQTATAEGQVDLATGWHTLRNAMIRQGALSQESNP